MKTQSAILTTLLSHSCACNKLKNRTTQATQTKDVSNENLKHFHLS